MVSDLPRGVRGGRFTFRDEMTRGAFRSFTHDRRFEDRGGVTLMVDEIDFRSPLGPLGRLFDCLFLTGYMRRLLERRCEAIKREAEAVAQRRQISLPAG